MHFLFWSLTSVIGLDTVGEKSSYKDYPIAIDIKVNIFAQISAIVAIKMSFRRNKKNSLHMTCIVAERCLCESQPW